MPASLSFSLFGYLRGTQEFPRIEHYIPVALGAITLAGLTQFTDVTLWKYAVATAAFCSGWWAAGHHGPVPLMATVALKGGGLIAEAKARPDVQLVEATAANRDGLPAEQQYKVVVEAKLTALGAAPAASASSAVVTGAAQ